MALSVADKQLTDRVGGIQQVYRGVSPNYYANGAGTTALAAGAEIDVQTALGRLGRGGMIVNKDTTLAVTVAIDCGSGTYGDDNVLDAGDSLSLGDGHGLLVSKIKLTEATSTANCRIFIY